MNTIFRIWLNSLIVSLHMYWWQKIHMMRIHSKTTMHVLSWEFVYVIQTFVSPINLIVMKILLDSLHGVMIKLWSEVSAFLVMNTIHSLLTKYIGILKTSIPIFYLSRRNCMGRHCDSRSRRGQETTRCMHCWNFPWPVIVCARRNHWWDHSQDCSNQYFQIGSQNIYCWWNQFSARCIRRNFLHSLQHHYQHFQLYPFCMENLSIYCSAYTVGTMDVIITSATTI